VRESKLVRFNGTSLDKLSLKKPIESGDWSQIRLHETIRAGKPTIKADDQSVKNARDFVKSNKADTVKLAVLCFMVSNLGYDGVNVIPEIGGFAKSLDSKRAP
jgi:hypothetical protein